jgi:glycine betaine transporter
MQLYVSAGIIGLITLWGLFAPASLDVAMQGALAVVTRNFGWFYLWVVLGLVLLALFLAVSRYGDLKLGEEDEEPAFSTLPWFSMLFAAGMGIGLVFWGVAEPLSHFAVAPPGVVPGTPEAANTAMRMAFFHWGLHPWAIYGIVGLAMAFFQFRRGRGALVSAATEALPWRLVQRASPLFNVLAVVATMFGIAASLGMGASQINSGLNSVFGVPVGPAAQVAIIAVTTVLFLWSALSGVERGIKLLSTVNMILAVLLGLAVLLLGPTIAIIDTFTSTLGDYLSQLVRMSLRMTPFRDSSWVGDWTIFYWAWWLSWSPFVGLFIARVSRGRTVRQFLVGTVLAPTLVGFAWFAIFGGAALHQQIFHQVPLVAAVQADVSTAIFAMFEAMPFGLVMSVVTTVLVVIFFVTSGDSATLVLAMMSSGGNPEPGWRVKLVWGLLIAAVATSLMLAGGLRAVQNATILFALPFAAVVVLMAVSVTRAIAEDWRAEQRRERELRRLVEAMVREAGSAPRRQSPP